jgi:hypothetical protein
MVIIIINLIGLVYLTTIMVLGKKCLNLFTKNENDRKCFMLVEFINISCITLYAIYMTVTLELKHCEFHENCYGEFTGVYLHSSIIKYQTYDTCSHELNSDIEKITENNYHQNDDCSDTLHGCCKLFVGCNTAFEYNMNYSEYQNHYLMNENVGMINTYIEKIDEYGSNCPEFHDIFDKKIINERNKIIMIYIHNTIIISFILILFLIKRCFEKEENEFSEVSTLETGSV